MVGAYRTVGAYGTTRTGGVGPHGPGGVISKRGMSEACHHRGD